MTSPSDRTERFSLRLSLDERAAVEDVRERLGAREYSENTVIALLITEAYHWRVVARNWDALPLDADSWGWVVQTADELGITTADALRLLILRGAPHQPQRDCMTPKPGFRQVPPTSDRLPVTAQRHPGVPEGPVYATPKPSGLPPVPPVPGQIDATTEEN